MTQSVTVSTYRPSLEEALGGPPTEAEGKVLAACKTGETAVFGTEPPEHPTPQNTIRAGLIRFLMLGGDATHQPHQKGVWIVGAWIDGVLDLEGCATPLDLNLFSCRFLARPNLQDAQLSGLYLGKSRFDNGIDLHRVRTDGPVQLDRAICVGPVDLVGARIGATLSCVGGNFEGLGGAALDCDAAEIGADVSLRDGFQAKGKVNLRGARITGQLACVGGQFDGQGGAALDCNAAEIGADVFLCEGFQAKGTVSFIRARITGQLACVKGQFDGQGGAALDCDAAEIGASVFLRDGFQAKGTVILRGARITGQLACVGGQFDGQGDAALDCNAAEIGADVFLCEGFQATGHVDFLRAKIAGNLQITNAQLDGAVILASAEIGEALFWKDVSGTVEQANLADATIGVLADDVDSWRAVAPGQLYLEGLRYENLSSAMSAQDRLDWLAKKAERNLPARNVDPPAWMVQTKDLSDFDPQPYTHLAQVYEGTGNRADAARIRYEREKRQRAAAQRRAWAQVDGSWRAGGRSVLVALQRIPDVIYRRMFGYGEHPVWALAWVLGIWAFGACLYFAAYQAGQMAPNSDVVLTSADWLRAVAEGCPVPADPGYAVAVAARCEMPLRLWEAMGTHQDYETFWAPAYAFDLFIPLDALGQELAWSPSKDRGALGAVGYYARWPIQIAGWLITAVGAAVLTGLVGRKE